MATTLTPKDLGPLADFVGTWSGDKGVNLVMVPKVAPGGKEGFTLMENHYRETITFTPFEGLVANRGGHTQQWVAGLRYDLVATDITKNVAIHVENGMILYLDHVENQPETAGQVDQFGKPVSNGPFTPLDFPVVRQASIPHGNTVAAPARVIVSQGPPPFNSTGLQTLLSANVENLPPLNDPGIGYTSGVQPHLFDGLKALETEIQNITNSKHTFGNMTTVIFDTANPNGSLVNIAFENKTTSSKFVPTRFQSIFWLEEIIDAHGHKSLVLQYGQRTDFLFNQAQNQTVDQGLILWPHINVNTLTKVLHSPHK